MFEITVYTPDAYRDHEFGPFPRSEGALWQSEALDNGSLQVRTPKSLTVFAAGAWRFVQMVEVSE